MKKNPRKPKAKSAPTPTFDITYGNCYHRLNLVQDCTVDLKFSGSLLKLYISRITHIEVEGNYTFLTMLVPGSAKGWERFQIDLSMVNFEFLESYGIIRVSRFEMVNLAYVYRITNSELHCYLRPEPIHIGSSQLIKAFEAMAHWYGQPSIK